MPLADAVAGAVRNPQQITWLREDGTPEDLTDATLSGVLFPEPGGPARAIAGSLVLGNPLLGQFLWIYALADVVAGSYRVQFTATYATGQSPARTFETSWQVAPALVVALA